MYHDARQRQVRGKIRYNKHKTTFDMSCTIDTSPFLTTDPGL